MLILAVLLIKYHSTEKKKNANFTSPLSLGPRSSQILSTGISILLGDIHLPLSVNLSAALPCGVYA